MNPDIPFDPDHPPDALPELPPGWTWGLRVTAEAEVVKADSPGGGGIAETN